MSARDQLCIVDCAKKRFFSPLLPHPLCSPSSPNATDATGHDITGEYDFTLEPWYADAVKAGKPLWSKIYRWTGGGDNQEILSISSSYPVYDDNKKLVGVLNKRCLMI
ncbi:cache domain-containing protein [Microseira wollei]|uniref:Multi-sensor hybrid histidine kinase n=1 Tax=Microseira wollei NIES-4236 TaxID=2530354 RepID=A0AAV3X390_9CYAN|nr:cache domain-containing protein [Microseira wollei]GET36698.1 multi-sensor hybrid histidine kinase [Microseira wollei NIES-4236]